MTKPRAPLSIDAALARIAGQLPGSWAEMALVADRHESTVRRWGDQDQPEDIPLRAAIALDIAFQRAGGDGAPLLTTYALMVRVSAEEAFADGLAIQRNACVLTREASQAIEAMVLAGMPGAGPAERARAVKELEDVHALIAPNVAALRPEPPP